MVDINNIYKPKGHPQISAPFKFITGELNNTHHPYEVAGVKVDDLKPTQPFVDNDLVDVFVKKLMGGEVLKPIWIDRDDNIIDGHHRYAAHLVAQPDTAIPAVRLMCKKQVAMDLLNTIQEEFLKHKKRFDQSELLRSISEVDDSMYVRDKDYTTKKELIVGYRKNPITKSLVGNFFVLKPISGYKAFEIEFDNVFNTDEIDKKIGTSSNPVQALCAVWFPSLDIKSRAKDFGMTPDKFINAIVAEKARTKKIDGIMYGEKLLQSIDEK